MRDEKKRETIWMYLCRERPPAPGAIPKGGVLEVGYDRMWCDGKLCWGWVQYVRELLPYELQEYELEYVWRSE